MRRASCVCGQMWGQLEPEKTWLNGIAVVLKTHYVSNVGPFTVLRLWVDCRVWVE